MKLNKKVFAGALALAMGLGVVAPAANSYAANESAHPGFTEEYAEFTKKYNEALEAYKTAQLNTEKAKKANDEARAEFLAAAKAVEDHEEKVESLEDAKDKALEELTKYVKMIDDTVEDANVVNKAEEIKKNYEVEKTNAIDDNETVSTIKSVIAHLDDYKKAKKAYDDENTEAKYDELVSARDKAEKKYGETAKALTKAENAEADAKEEYEDAKEKALVAGVSKIVIAKAEEKGEFIVVPTEPSEEEDLTEKIEASLKANKEKLSALKAVKKYMPESYKKYKKVIDEAVEEAEKAIKQAEDFLGKKVAFVTVAHASDATNEPTAEEVLKDLEESEKKLDDAINQVEQDNKEKNEAEEENKEDNKEEEKEDNKEEEKEDSKEEEKDKPEVTEKEDKTPSKNVKTGVAGVAGVGAVLAAASAAYVSSKRK